MEYELDIISSGELTVEPEKIERAVELMIAKSNENYAEISDLALECTAALRSAEARAEALSDRGLLKRMWDSVTGNDDKVRYAIAKDNATAQYAMQQTVNRILQESTRNRELLLLVKAKVEHELICIQKEQVGTEREVNRIRSALVGFFNKYMDDAKRIQEHCYTRCEACNKEIAKEQIICKDCGTIQRLKWERLPKDMQKKFEDLSEIMKSKPGEWDVDKCWDITVGKYAEIAGKTRAIALGGEIVKQDGSLYKDLGNLIQKCQNSEFQIAVVGVLKAGKSMLMNALIGMDLASTGLNSKTAALTKFRSSSSGHYVKVSFYTSEQWNRLKESAGKNKDHKDDSFWTQLRKPSVIEGEKTWINHKPIINRYKDVNLFKKDIEKWTAAESAEHLFARVVEVGIDKSVFDMPDEVVFVDTPGLQDPVRYRSRITEQYISRADAVLVAVPIRALTTEGFSTITTVLDHAGNNTKKVYIVGTQKDTLQKVDDYEEIMAEWVNKLVAAGRYKKGKDAQRQMFATSAYMHLCMKKALELDVADLEDEEKFALADYTNFQGNICKIIAKRSYVIENLRYDKETQSRIIDDYQIQLLKQRVEDDLIKKYRELKIKDISTEFVNCKKQLLVDASKMAHSYKTIVENATKGTNTLEEKMKQVFETKKDLEQDKVEFERMMKELRNLTEIKIKTLGNKEKKVK